MIYHLPPPPTFPSTLHRLPVDNFRPDFYLHRAVVGGFDDLDEAADGHLAHVLFGDVDGAEGRLNVGAQGHVVEADDADIPGDDVAHLLDGFHGAGGD